ncbi:MAG: hypothetical protein P8Y45_23365, partial [Exilibacterium sp.]
MSRESPPIYLLDRSRLLITDWFIVPGRIPAPSYTYDRLSRRSTTKTKLSGNLGTYVEKVTYDSIGRVDKVFDAAGD